MSKKGFTLLEIVIATFIFSLIMVAVSQIFGSLILGYKKARMSQQNIEIAQGLINEISKKLRTSSIVSCNDADCPTDYPANKFKKFRWINYSTNECGEYEFDDVIKVIKSRLYSPNASETDPVLACRSGSLIAGSEKILSRMSDARFNTYASNNIDDPATPLPNNEKRAGKIIFMFKICNTDDCDTPSNPHDEIWVQSTVSLRDYEVSGVKF